MNDCDIEKQFGDIRYQLSNILYILKNNNQELKIAKNLTEQICDLNDCPDPEFKTYWLGSLISPLIKIKLKINYILYHDNKDFFDLYYNINTISDIHKLLTDKNWKEFLF